MSSGRIHSLFTGTDPGAQGMTQLQELHLAGSLRCWTTSVYTALRKVTLSGDLRDGPSALLAPTASVSGSDAHTHFIAADALFSGHERLWRGLL